MQKAQPLSGGGEVVEPWLEGEHNDSTITDKLASIILHPVWRTPRGWILGFAIAFVLLMMYFLALGMLFYIGVGIWGINVPIAWGFDIINFVWWIGIGHAGTLISAILLLLRQEWRTSINRFAEAMTIFAVACAGLYPILHLGRIYLFYWLLPYPNTLGMWTQFRSPLEWDVFAVSTYASVSIVFWLVGLIPDFATLRDRAQNRAVKWLYGLAALGWRGSAKHWHRYELVSLLLAGLSTPLVVSVHTIVSFDFAVSQLPGWHVTVFPPYFVAGAVYSGFAMVLTLMIPVRAFYKLQDFLTIRHLDTMAKVMLTTGLIVAYGYGLEAFTAWYSANEFEWYMFINRASGPYWWSYWALILCNVLLPQLLWIKRVRRNIPALFVLSIIINIGMWLERFVIIVTSLHRDFLPSSWGMYYPSIWDWATYIGSFGLFFTLLFLFIRALPMINIFEMRHLRHVVHHDEHHDADGHAPAKAGAHH